MLIGEFSMEEYTPSELSEDNFRFDADIPEPVSLSIQDAYIGNLYLDDITQYPFLSVKRHGEPVSNVSSDIAQFLRNKKSGSSVAGLHSRDDHLFNVLEWICGINIQRNTTSTSTAISTRPDGQLGNPDSPPTVLFEEKKTDHEIGAACNDLQNKFTFLPQYARLRFIVGIAIAGDSMIFGKLHRSGFDRMLSLTLNNVAQRLRYL
jgi:hypothetical protein